MCYLYSVVVTLILVTTIYNVITYQEQKRNRRIRIDTKNMAFKHHNKTTVKNTIVFLGDSITEQFNVSEYFLNLPVINRGVSGNFTYEVLDRLNDVISLHPSKIILCIGTNDLSIKSNNVEDTLHNLIKIVDSLVSRMQSTKLIVLPLFPINTSKEPKIKRRYRKIAYYYKNRIATFNQLLLTEMSKKGIQVIDMTEELVNHDGNLKLEYTTDGIHLTHQAYDIVYKQLINNI